MVSGTRWVQSADSICISSARRSRAHHVELRCQHVRMAGSEHLAPRMQGFLIERLRLTSAALVVVVCGQIVEAGRLHTLMRDTPKAATISADPLPLLKLVHLFCHMRSPLLGLATGTATEGSNVPLST
jgi:hypothetical protein